LHSRSDGGPAKEKQWRRISQPGEGRWIFKPKRLEEPKMTRYEILAVIALTLGFSAVAKGNQAGASVQAQTNTSAAATAGNSEQNQKSVSASASSGTAASANANSDSLALAGGTAVQATLVTSLDAKHSKQGDPVFAKTTQDVKQDGQIVLRKGSELNGHVTQVQARSKETTQSTLGVVFDSAVPKGKHDSVPVDLSIRALAAAQNQTAASLGDDQANLGAAGQARLGAAAPAGGGLVRGVGGAVGGATSTAGSVTGDVGHTAGGAVGAASRTVASAGSTGGLNAAGQLTSNSSGVFNLDGMNLSSAVSNGTQASVVSSANHNVHLASGTQMVLQVERQ
jgi:hypothetical protein